MTAHSSTFDAERLRRIQLGTRATLMLGIGASLAANVLAADPTAPGRVIAAWSPLALLLTVELLSRVPIVVGGWLSRIRVAAAAGIAAVAAWVSYWHMVEVAIAYGEAAEAAHLLPLSVDGLVIVASVSLMEISNRLQALEVSADVDELSVVSAPSDTQLEQSAASTAVAPLELAPAQRAAETVEPTVEFAAQSSPAVSRPVAPVTPAVTATLSEGKGSANDRVAAFLVEHPGGKQVEIAEALAVTTKTVGRTDAWKNRHQVGEVAA